jgi:biopolymer transport protein ExbB
MKHIMMFMVVVMAIAGASYGEDLRVAGRKAKADYEAALAEAGESRTRILKDKEALATELERAERSVSALQSEIEDLQRRLHEVQAAETALSRERSEEQMDLREYAGVVMDAARDLESLLSQSHFTALHPDRLDRLQPVLAFDRFPGMDDLAVISDLFFEQMTLSGEVDLTTGPLIASDGSQTTGEILTIGGFCAAYRLENETGFLHYNEAEHRLFSLSKRPPWSMRRNLDKYMGGEVEDVSFDFARGAALRQLSHQSDLWDKIKEGGPIVWPILGIGLAALILALERMLFLNRVHANTDRLMGRVNELAGRGDWPGCDDVLRHEEGKPVCNVLRAGLSAAKEKRETLESVLQEAILKELPRLERFLPAINIMGAVAPLLGLLGTVTGMIDTFQAITLYGSGDPKMMSGGISEALITTMLGLSVAIPIMLAHTFLRRRLEHIVGDMEEKAVALSNIICREGTLVPLVKASSSGSGVRPAQGSA